MSPTRRAPETRSLRSHFPNPTERSTYPIAVLKQAKDPELARKFVDVVTGETGQVPRLRLLLA